MKRKFMYLLLWVLGFSAACSDKKEDGPVDMYAPLPPEPLRITLSGRVTDAAGTPIPQIQISRPNSGQHVMTDENGMYVIPASSSVMQFSLIFTDIDGEENGGDFAEKRIELEFAPEEVTVDEYGISNISRTGVDVVLEAKAQ